METIRPTKCPHCWSALAVDDGLTCPHCLKATAPPTPAPSTPPPPPAPPSPTPRGPAPSPVAPIGTGTKLSQPGRVLIAVLIAMGVYALARCVDQIDRLHFVDGLRNGGLAYQVAIGRTTLATIHAKARALDHRNSYFVAASWIGSLASWAAYRNWRTRTPLRPHTAQTQQLERAVTMMWGVALGAQFLRMGSSVGGNLAGLHTDALINLASRAILIPAVAVSIVLVRLREGLPVRAAAPFPPSPTDTQPPNRPQPLDSQL